jgi:branched-chain amino acid transport system ATP-binding protein
MRLLELARAVVDEPQLLLLDEPTSGLSQRDSEVLGDVIRDLSEHHGCAYLLVEHDMEFVFRHADRVLVMVAGQVIADGAAARVARDPAVVEAYLGPAAADGREIV